MLQTWESSTVGGAGRVAALRDFVCDTLVDCDLGTDEEAGIEVQLTRAQTGTINLLQYRSEGRQWCARRGTHLRSDPGDEFLVYLPRTARISIEQQGRSSVIQPGQLGVLSSAHAYRGDIGPDEDRSFLSYHLRVPGPLLRERLPTIDDLVGYGLPLAAETNDVFNHVLPLIFAQAARGGERVVEMWCSALVEMLCATIEQGRKSLPESATRPVRPRDTARMRAQELILSRLSDPELNVAGIARQLNMSQRYLHTIFGGSGESLCRWIRRQRLEHCRRDLLNQELRDRKIAETAYRWGFSDLAHFSRAYKSAFGASPSHDRERQAAGAGLAH
jgi:AraC-like DNA-binding protein